MRVVVLVALAGLSGCGAIERRDAMRAVHVAVAQCKATYPLERGTALAREHCIETANAPALRYQQADLINLLRAYDAGLAEKVDAGTLSPSDAAIMAANESVQITEMERQRDAQDAEVRAEGDAANAAQTSALLQASQQMLQPPRSPVYMLPQQQTTHTNCYYSGAFLNCTSN